MRLEFSTQEYMTRMKNLQIWAEKLKFVEIHKCLCGPFTNVFLWDNEVDDNGTRRFGKNTNRTYQIQKSPFESKRTEISDMEYTPLNLADEEEK